MFYYLQGALVLREPTCCVIDCGGVGYKLTVSLNTSSLLVNKMGEPVKLMTHMQVREDGIELFGFISLDEMDTFKQLTSVSGVGPKAAMSILSLLSPERLRLAICTEDTKAISKAPGIGAKTAARIVLELRDKLSQGMLSTSPSSLGGTVKGYAPAPESRKLSDALEALMALGYDRTDSMKALQGIDVEKNSINEIIALALKKFL